MRVSRTLLWLCSSIALLAVVASGMGIFHNTAGEPFIFESLRGQPVEIYGRGLYAYDWSFRAPVLRGADTIILFVCVPLLLSSMVLYRRGSLRGGILLTGTLACFLYNAASLAFGAAYNDLFLVYVAYFSASLYAFVLAFSSIDTPTLAAHISPQLPHRGIAIFIFVAGLSPCVWLIDIVSALLQGQVPQGLASYTTDITTVIDVGIITPAAFLAGVLLLRRKPLGYLLSSTLLILLVLIGMIVVGQTVMQILDGIVLTPGEVIAFVAPFITLSMVAVGLTITLLRNVAPLETV